MARLRPAAPSLLSRLGPAEGPELSDGAACKACNDGMGAKTRFHVSIFPCLSTWASQQGEIAFEFHQVLAAIDQQRGASDGLVVDGKFDRGCHIGGG